MRERRIRRLGLRACDHRFGRSTCPRTDRPPDHRAIEKQIEQAIAVELELGFQDGRHHSRGSGARLPEAMVVVIDGLREKRIDVPFRGREDDLAQDRGVQREDGSSSGQACEHGSIVMVRSHNLLEESGERAVFLLQWRIGE